MLSFDDGLKPEEASTENSKSGPVQPAYTLRAGRQGPSTNCLNFLFIFLKLVLPRWPSRLAYHMLRRKTMWPFRANPPFQYPVLMSLDSGQGCVFPKVPHKTRISLVPLHTTISLSQSILRFVGRIFGGFPAVPSLKAIRGCT